MKLPDDLGIRYGGSCYRFIISRMHAFFNPVFHKSIYKNTFSNSNTKLYSEKYNLIIHIRDRVCYNRLVKSHKVCMHDLNTN